MKQLSVILFALLASAASSAQTSSGSKDSIQTIRVEVNRIERKDAFMGVDMNIDLTEVRLIPDCMIYLHPWLKNGADSLPLPVVVVNGPQSDMMYRRRESLGKNTDTPVYVVIREGGNRLPRINYRKNDIPYESWMDGASLLLRDQNCNCDARLIPFSIEVEKTSPLVVVQRDTVVIRDTVTIDRPVAVAPPVVEKKKETVTEHAGYRADIYFPVSGMKILPEHELNRVAWRKFVSETDSLRMNNNNTVLGITVTGYSSPEGAYNTNERIAKQRAFALKNYLETVYDSAQVEIRAEWVAEDWDGLTEMVRNSEMPDKDKVLQIIEDVDVNKGRESRLQRLSGGAPWRYMTENFFPKLRYASCRIGYLKRSEK